MKTLRSVLLTCWKLVLAGALAHIAVDFVVWGWRLVEAANQAVRGLIA